jgi:transposase
MPRSRRAPTEEWEQVRLLLTDAIQETYELLRPVLLFGQAAAERARETGTPERTLQRKAARFAAYGMRSLFDEPVPTTEARRQLPPEIRQAIVRLKAEYPPFSLRELAVICRRRFGRPVSHHTVKQVLTTEPLPVDPPRRFRPYHAIPDPVQRRLAVVHLDRDGWSVRAIAGYLAVSRTTVSEVLARWKAERWPGLVDRSHAPHHPATKVDLAAMTAVRRLQGNPLLGAFRVHAALAQQGIDLSPRTCGRILARHRDLGAPQPTRREREPRPMPFAASRWHQWWSVDVRYVEDHRLGTGKPAYVIAVLDNFSRAILASAISPRQDLTAYLVVLRTALERYGVPEGLVSDSGGVFKAGQARRLYEALGINKREIDRGQPWQNYIETTFAIMRRMADHDFAGAETWDELAAVHARFVRDYNHQPHSAHRAQRANRRSPLAVLSWVRGRPCDPDALDRLLRWRATRRLRSGGVVRFRHWRLYAERGLVGATVAVWLAGETLTLEYDAVALAQYRVAYERNGHHLRAVTDPQRFPSRFAAPQPFRPMLEAVTWEPAQRLPPYRPRRHSANNAEQARLLPTVAVGRPAIDAAHPFQPSSG